MPVTARDVQWFSEFVLRLHACTTERNLFALLLPAVHEKFGSIISQAEESSWDFSGYREHGMYGDMRPPPDYVPAIVDHPLVVRLFSGRRFETMHRAALVRWDDFARTTFYNVLFRPFGMKDQLLAAINTGPDSVACFGVNRDTEFTRREALLMEAVRRHAEACLLRVRRSCDAVAGLAAREILLGPDLRPLELGPSLRNVLGAYFGRWRSDAFAPTLPEELARWVRSALALLHTRPPRGPLWFFRTDSARGRLWVRLFPQQAHGHTLRFTEELRAASALALRDQGMTLRECEVLHWLRAGKRDAEIALILGTTSRTAEKHVESLLRKLGARNRQDAARRATDLLDRS